MFGTQVTLHDGDWQVNWKGQGRLRGRTWACQRTGLRRDCGGLLAKNERMLIL